MKWRSPSAPMFDSARSSTGPRLRISPTNGSRPSPGRKPVVTGAPRTLFGGQETNGLADWDDHRTSKVASEPVIRQIVKDANVLHRLRRPDGTTIETRLILKAVHTKLVDEWNNPTGESVTSFKVATKRIDSNPWVKERKRKISPRGTIITMDRVNELIKLGQQQGIV